MATPGVLGSASNANTLERPTPPPAPIEGKGLFLGLSNRPTDDPPPPESETPAPVGAGNGGEKLSWAAHEDHTPQAGPEASDDPLDDALAALARLPKTDLAWLVLSLAPACRCERGEPVFVPDFLKTAADHRRDLVTAWRALGVEDRAEFLARVNRRAK